MKLSIVRDSCGGMIETETGNPTTGVLYDYDQVQVYWGGEFYLYLFHATPCQCVPFSYE